MIAKDRLIKARIKMSKDQPFFGRLSMLLNLRKTKMVSTAGVDGENFYFNEKYINALNDEEISGLFMHEVLHVALGHLWRVDKRIRAVWNIAADYAVNVIVTKNDGVLPDKSLLDRKYDEMSAEMIYDILIKDFDTGDKPECSQGLPKSSPEDNDESGGGQGGDSDDDEDSDGQSGDSKGKSKKNDEEDGNEKDGGGSSDESEDNEDAGGEGGQGDGESDDNEEDDKEGGNSGKEKDKDKDKEKKKDKKDGKGSEKDQSDEVEEDHEHTNEKEKRCRCGDGHQFWGKASKSDKKNQVKAQWEAAMEGIARQQGRSPAGMERIIEELQPQEDWKAILSNYLSPSKSDFDFMRRDRRSLNSPFYFPDLAQGEALEDVVAAIDTSGSIYSEELSYFVSEIRNLFNVFDDVKGWLIDCDASVKSFVPIEDSKDKTVFSGGGGTDHTPIFDEIKERGITPRVVICFTDLYTSFPSYVPEYPVLWLVTEGGSDREPPFGRVIKLKGRIDE